MNIFVHFNKYFKMNENVKYKIIFLLQYIFIKIVRMNCQFIFFGERNEEVNNFLYHDLFYCV